MRPLPTFAKSKTWQQRAHESRLGTVFVLAVTAVIVMGAAYVVDRPAAAKAGTTVVAVSTAGDSASPKIGAVAPNFTATIVRARRSR